MKIALFSDAIPPRIDGVAMTVARLSSELARHGHDVALVGPGAFDELAGVSVSIRLPSIDLPKLPGLRGSAPLLFGSAARQLDRFAPDLVHALTEMPVGLAGRRYAIDRAIPFVTSAHTDYPAYLRHWGIGTAAPLMREWMNWFHRAASVTMCPSESYLRTLRAGGHDGRCRIWSRGVDPDRFSPKHRSSDLRRRYAPNGEKIVLSVGRVVPEKRIGDLIDAFAKASRHAPRSILLIVGDGASRTELERRAIPNVSFVGARTGLALSEIYASSDVFAVASREETFGNAVLEAMASGLPIVAPRAGALAELVDTSCGLLVAPQADAASVNAPNATLSEALATLTSNDAQRVELGEAARRLALHRTWAKATAEVLSSYVLALEDERRFPALSARQCS